MARTQPLLVALLFPLTLMACTAVAQESIPWYRQPHLNGVYDLSKTKILVIAGQSFNPGETLEMAECWKRWGAEVSFAGAERTLTGENEGESAPTSPPTLQVDYLLPEVDPSSYDVLYIAGGEGVPDLLANNREHLARIIDGVHNRGKIVSAICHGPMALSASAAIRGKRLTVQGDAQRRALEEAGAVLVNEIAIVDGQFVTGQWPHLEAFAVTLAERVQFPSGGGPYQTMMEARSPVERAVDDLRNSHRFEAKPVPPELLGRLARAAQRACAPPASPGCGAIKFVVVEEQSSKTKIADVLFERSKSEFIARGVTEKALRSQITALVEQAPVLLVQFVNTSQEGGGENASRAQRLDFASAGSASAHIVLVARSAGLGVYSFRQPFSLLAEPAIRQLLRVPETAQLIGIFSVGYPTVTGTPAVARPMSEIFYRERWESPVTELRDD